MSYTTNSTYKKKKSKLNKKKAIFLKTLLISLAFLSVIILSGWLLVKNIMKPPEIPVYVDKSPKVDIANEIAFIIPENSEDDLLVGGGLDAPEDFHVSDRKELFYTFLIIGLDKGVNTDTIMVASYDGVNKEANIISIPRDSLVNVKRRVKKINSAYPAGTLNGGGRQGGIEQLKRELKTIIGFAPDFYVCIDLKAFEKIVDAVGGVEIDVPYNMVYDDPIQDLHIDIRAGQRTLNGATALKFARYRTGNEGYITITDYQRIENQQAVIKAMLKKLLTPGIITKVPEFINIFTEYVHTDIKPENIIWFAEQLNQVRGNDALTTHTIPTTGNSGLPMYYELLDEAGIVELVNSTINPYTKNIEAKDLDIIGE